MNKLLTTLFIVAGLGFSLLHGSVHAQKVNRISKKASPKVEAVEKVSTDGQTASQFNCELGDKITVYKNPADDSFVNVQWRNQTYRMERATTTTGAHRYESKKAGLVYISIPAKSMLFDSAKGRQLANECRNSDQRRAVTMAQSK